MSNCRHGDGKTSTCLHLHEVYTLCLVRVIWNWKYTWRRRTWFLRSNDSNGQTMCYIVLNATEVGQLCPNHLSSNQTITNNCFVLSKRVLNESTRIKLWNQLSLILWKSMLKNQGTRIANVSVDIFVMLYSLQININHIVLLIGMCKFVPWIGCNLTVNLTNRSYTL